MEKKLQNYLHLYLGCEMVRPHGKKEGWVLRGVLVGNTNWQVLEGNDEVIRVATAKPILRPLSSMTEDELKEWQEIRFNEDFKLKPLYSDADYNAFAWLLSKHFDVFNLIPDGLALSTT